MSSAPSQAPTESTNPFDSLAPSPAEIEAAQTQHPEATMEQIFALIFDAQDLASPEEKAIAAAYLDEEKSKPQAEAESEAQPPGPAEISAAQAQYPEATMIQIYALIRDENGSASPEEQAIAAAYLKEVSSAPRKITRRQIIGLFAAVGGLAAVGVALPAYNSGEKFYNKERVVHAIQTLNEFFDKTTPQILKQREMLPYNKSEVPEELILEAAEQALVKEIEESDAYPKKTMEWEEKSAEPVVYQEDAIRITKELLAWWADNSPHKADLTPEQIADIKKVFGFDTEGLEGYHEKDIAYAILHKNINPTYEKTATAFKVFNSILPLDSIATAIGSKAVMFTEEDSFSTSNDHYGHWVDNTAEFRAKQPLKPDLVVEAKRRNATTGPRQHKTQVFVSIKQDGQRSESYEYTQDSTESDMAFLKRAVIENYQTNSTLTVTVDNYGTTYQLEYKNTGEVIQILHDGSDFKVTEITGCTHTAVCQDQPSSLSKIHVGISPSNPLARNRVFMHTGHHGDRRQTFQAEEVLDGYSPDFYAFREFRNNTGSKSE